jgi:hypothetical protein
MSLLPSDTFYTPGLPIYLREPLRVSTAQISSLNVNSLTANRINATSTLSGFFEGNYGEISNWYVDEKLYVNFQELTADSDQLFLNGIPVATTANLSSIQNWSYFAQVSTLDGNNQSTIGLSLLESSTIKTPNLVASNIFTQNLMAYNIVNFTSTVVEVYESTIQSDVKLANISTANINNLNVSSGNFSTLNSINGAFNNISAGTTFINTLTGGTASFSNFTASSITVSTIISPPAASANFSSITVVSNTNTGSLTVGSNNTTTFAAAPTFSDGANFNGTRPNFNAGINTTAANNFNNTTLDNVGRITANTVFVGSSNYVEIQTSSFTSILNNRGADVGGNSVIDLKSRFGAATRVNITADASSALAPTPTQIVTITANGATSLTQNAVGGRVSIVANAGSGAGCNILGFGQIDLTAFSSAPFAGVIKESAGSILAYSGLTVPAVGVPGGSFYSALTTLSLTCGVTPATTSFPGVVYLRGDNGTKVDNGFTADTVTATSNAVLNTVTTNGLTAFTGSSLAFFATSQNIQFNSATVGFNAVIAGPLSVSSITNVSTINGSPYVPGGGGGGGSFVSTATSDLNMNGFKIRSPSSIGISTLYGFINIDNATNDNTITISTTALKLTGDSGVDLTSGDQFNITTYDAYIQASNEITMVTSNLLSLDSQQTFVRGISTLTLRGDNISLEGNITALSTLSMSDNPIKIRNDGTTGLAWGSAAPYSVAVDGPFLFGNTQGALGTTSTINDISLAWDTNKVEMYKKLDMNGNGIGDGSGLLTLSSINVGIAGSTSVGLVAGYVSTGVSILLVSPNQIDLVSPTVTRDLVGVGVAQPVIQYGTDTVTGLSGSVAVTLGTPYTSVSSYVAFISMMDSTPAETSVSRDSDSQITLSWNSGGGGTHILSWQTLGT